VVTAVDLMSHESGNSTQASATPTDPPPAASTGLGATPGDAEVSLDWDDNSEDDLNGYNVYRSLTSGDNYTKVNGSLVETSDYTDDTVTNEVIYYYVVTAVDLMSNESGYSDEASATPSEPPVAPTGLVATSGDEQINLDWNDNSESDLDGYNVYRSTDSGGPYTKINSSLVESSAYTNTGLTNKVTYYYVVTAVDLISNESGNSSEDSATPMQRLTLLDDSFEGDPWDANWDDNEETTWVLDAKKNHGGLFSAKVKDKEAGNLYSDDLDASSAFENITVEFWFRPKEVVSGDVVVEIYNGSTLVAWYDLANYPTYAEETWCEFSEVITDSQYFISNFRVRFNASAMIGKEMYIDDVLIKTNNE